MRATTNCFVQKDIVGIPVVISQYYFVIFKYSTHLNFFSNASFCLIYFVFRADIKNVSNANRLRLRSQMIPSMISMRQLSQLSIEDRRLGALRSWLTSPSVEWNRIVRLLFNYCNEFNKHCRASAVHLHLRSHSLHSELLHIAWSGLSFSIQRYICICICIYKYIEIYICIHLYICNSLFLLVALEARDSLADPRAAR